MKNQLKHKSNYMGLQDNIKDLKISPSLEVIENIYSDKDYIVELKTNEFTSICPKTSLPDFATITIQYRPDKFLVEQKSLKLYLCGYRNIGIFQEHASNKILSDFVNATKPKWAKIITEWKSRGGISTIVEVEYKNKKKSKN